MNERITIFGNISDITAKDIHAFVGATLGHEFGGSYPDLERTVPEEEVITNNRDALAQAGVESIFPVVPCRSPRERAEVILSYCRQRSAGKNGSVKYLILDQNPASLAKEMQATISRNPVDPDGETVLKSVTVISLGAPKGSDYTDPKTGIRVGALPYPIIPYPTHPTPES